MGAAGVQIVNRAPLESMTIALGAKVLMGLA
jgi:hypothetical protein